MKAVSKLKLSVDIGELDSLQQHYDANSRGVYILCLTDDMISKGFQGDKVERQYWSHTEVLDNIYTLPGRKAVASC